MLSCLQADLAVILAGGRSLPIVAPVQLTLDGKEFGPVTQVNVCVCVCVCVVREGSG
jgi:hypothetical protein